MSVSVEGSLVDVFVERVIVDRSFRKIWVSDEELAKADGVTVSAFDLLESAFRSERVVSNQQACEVRSECSADILKLFF